jgi:outer membrane protein assembly factor BamB
MVWTIPGGGSPDMGGVSADGKVLWLTGRYDREVYAFDTDDGRLLARIKVGHEPHGLCVYPAASPWAIPASFTETGPWPVNPALQLE